MGVTTQSLETIKDILKWHPVGSVVDAGAQNQMFNEHLSNPDLKGKYPYMSEWWRQKGVRYMSIDLTGENNCERWDLDQPLPTQMKFDLVCDFGTGEHVRNFYQCMRNIHNLCKVGGVIIRENPLIRNWPQHGFNYVDPKFYVDLCEMNGYQLIKIDLKCAMGNFQTGWNCQAIYKKVKDSEFAETIPWYLNTLDNPGERSQENRKIYV